MSLPFLALREKLLNGELFGWAGGYRELRTELQRGDRGRVWPWRLGSWAGGCSIIPASVTWLLVRPELRNSPNMSRRNISRWRAATKNQIIIILLLVFDGVWMAWVIIDRERAMVHEDLGFSILTL